MDEKERQRAQLECLYDMFRDKIEENVIYIVYSENNGKIEQTIDQLISIAACSLTGYYFEPPKSLLKDVQNGTEACTISRQSSQSHSFRDESPSSMTTVPKAADDDFKPVRRSKRVHSYQNKKKEEIRQNGRENHLINGDAYSSAGTSDNTERESIEDEDIDGNDQEDEEQLDLDERIEGLQNSIEILLNEKGTCHDKACQYLNKKMFPVTSYYSELASQYRRTIEEKTRKLVDLLLMKSENANTIDLHGLNPIQAKLVVTELLNRREDKLPIDKQGQVTVDIITGWGKHTVAEGNHRIRPTIANFLRENGYEYYHLNKGAFRVTLKR